MRAISRRRLISSVIFILCSGTSLGFQQGHRSSLSSCPSVRSKREAAFHQRGFVPRRRALFHPAYTGYKGPRWFVSQGRIEAETSDLDFSNASTATRSTSPQRGRWVSMLLSRLIRNGRTRQDSNQNANNGASTVSILPPNQQDELERLRRENIILRETVFKLEAENEKLHQDFANRIVIETFEGEGKLRKAREEVLDDDEDDLEASFMLMSEEQMLYDDPAQWCDELEEGACPVEPTISFGEALRDRAYWLVGLLVMQSLSGIILARNEALLANHPVIIYFLTMLVGAGGNAGNQASVRVIRGLALGTLNDDTQAQFLTRELKMAVSLSTILSIAGFLRAAVFHTPLPETLAVTAALAMIVFSSICLGAILPLILKRIGVDPAHSSTTIQVVMDILGVILAVLVSNLLLDSPFGHLLVSRLSRS